MIFETKKEGAKEKIMMSFIICALQLILLQCLNKEQNRQVI
jgi:hypothetical protein